MADNPYREPDRATRYVCIVCFGAAEATAGPCRLCSAPLAALNDPAVVDELRKRAQKVLKRRTARELGVMFGVPIVLSVVLFATLIATGVYDLTSRPLASGGIGRGGMGDFWPLGLMLAVLIVLSAALYPRIFKKSALSSKFDPDQADVGGLLNWIGLSSQS